MIPTTCGDASCIHFNSTAPQMDAHYIATKAAYIRPRHYKERLMLEIEAAVTQRFAPLLALAGQHGVPNAKVRTDQQGYRVLREERDYLGSLVDVERIDAQGRTLPGATDAELAVMQASYMSYAQGSKLLSS